MKTCCKALTILVFTFSLALQADPTSGLKKKPVNPEFETYRQWIQSGKQIERNLFSERGYGHLPPPMAPFSGEALSSSPYPVDSLPTSYDLRQANRVTSIKNQSSCGACWAFAAMGSIESSLMPGEQRDFSEEHLILNHGFDYDPCEGGQPWMSLAYLSRWGGPLNENDFSYKLGNSSGTGYVELTEKHIQEAVFLPQRSGYTDNDKIKQFIMNKGAVVISYYADDAYLNPSTGAYYCTQSGRTNHEVVIVGWDDNYSASNFSVTPGGKGAFIVKNSWGPTWGKQGYFYMSYYDKSLSSPVSFYNARPISDYGTNYYYDPLGWCTSFGYNSGTAWGANVFEAVNDQPIDAVSVILGDVNTQCQIMVYRNATRQNPRAGTLVSQQTLSKPYPGYYTVKLNKPLTVSRGQLFSVVVRFQNGGTDQYPVAVEYPYEEYSSQAESSPGESFVSANGQNWEDLSDYYASTCIKAFSRRVDPGMSVSVEKVQVEAWMISRSVASIAVNFSNAEASRLNKIIIFRKTTTDEDYAVWREVPVSEMNGGACSCTDAFLDEYKQYSYKVVAVDENGSVLANSGDQPLE